MSDGLVKVRASSAGEALSRLGLYGHLPWQDGLYVALMKGIWLSHLADLDAGRIRAVDEGEAASLEELSSRLQLAVAALLGVKLTRSTTAGSASSGAGRPRTDAVDASGDSFLCKQAEARRPAAATRPSE